MNATYRVRWGSRLFLLRLHGKPDFEGAFIESELRFLAWLRGEVPFAVQTPIRGAQGEWTTTCDGRFVSLLSWLDGEICDVERVEWHELAAIGRMIGQLHAATQRYVLPPDWQRPGGDSTELFGSTSPGDLIAQGWNAADRSVGRLLEEAKRLTLAAEQALGHDEGHFGVIHGDLHFANIVRTGAGFSPIDFDDMGCGFFIYDLAVTLAKMLGLPDYETRREALLEGYAGVRSLDSQSMELLPVFVATRTASMVLWGLGAALARPALRQNVQGWLPALSDKLERQLAAL